MKNCKKIITIDKMGKEIINVANANIEKHKFI